MVTIGYMFTIGPVLETNTESFVKLFGYVDFKCSLLYARRFCQRHSIIFNRVCDDVKNIL